MYNTENSLDYYNLIYTPYALLARDSIYGIACYMLSPVRLSVRLSVTRVDQSKRLKLQVRLMQLSPQSCPVTLVSSWLTSQQNSKKNIGNGDAAAE